MLKKLLRYGPTAKTSLKCLAPSASNASATLHAETASPLIHRSPLLLLTLSNTQIKSYRKAASTSVKKAEAVPSAPKVPDAFLFETFSHCFRDAGLTETFSAIKLLISKIIPTKKPGAAILKALFTILSSKTSTGEKLHCLLPKRAVENLVGMFSPLDPDEAKRLAETTPDTAQMISELYARIKAKKVTKTRAEPSCTITEVAQLMVELENTSGKGTSTTRAEKIYDFITTKLHTRNEVTMLMRVLTSVSLGCGEKKFLSILAEVMYENTTYNPGSAFTKADILNYFTQEMNRTNCFDELITNLMKVGDLSSIAGAAVTETISKSSTNNSVICKVPVPVMLCRVLNSTGEVMRMAETQDLALEWKYDGERTQLHYINEGGVPNIRSFSRTGIDSTEKLKPLIKVIHESIKDKKNTTSFVIDSELIAYDKENKIYLPFQALQRRYLDDEMLENVALVVYDILYYNGDSVMRQSMRERREMVNNLFNYSSDILMCNHIDILASESHEEKKRKIIEVFNDSVNNKNEGLIVKVLSAPYEEGKRSKFWQKLKKDYISSIQDTLDLVPIGGLYGKGKRAGVYGSFILASYNPKRDMYETICKIGTGFDDKDLTDFTKRMSDYVTSDQMPCSNYDTKAESADVWFEPKEVWEIIAAEYTRSSTHSCGVKEGSDGLGYSVRFPRFVRIRTDKTVAEASTTDQIVEMAQNQFNKTVDSESFDASLAEVVAASAEKENKAKKSKAKKEADIEVVEEVKQAKETKTPKEPKEKKPSETKTDRSAAKSPKEPKESKEKKPAETKAPIKTPTRAAKEPKDQKEVKEKKVRTPANKQ